MTKLRDILIIICCAGFILYYGAKAIDGFNEHLHSISTESQNEALDKLNRK